MPEPLRCTGAAFERRDNPTRATLTKRLRLAQRFPFCLRHELQDNVLALPEGETDAIAIAFRVRELGLKRQSDEEPLPEDGMGQEIPFVPFGAIGCRRFGPVDRIVNYVKSP